MGTSSQHVPGSLDFKAYESDPLANFLITRFVENTKRQWPVWRIGLIYVAGFLLAAGVAGLVRIVNNDFALPLYGGYDGIAIWVIFVSAVGGFGPIFYIYISRKAGSIFEDLAAAEVIKGDTVTDIVIRESTSVKAKHNSNRWQWLVLLIATSVIVIVIYQSGFAPNRNLTTEYRALSVYLLSPLTFIGVYMLLMILVRAFVTIWGLIRVFRVPGVDVHPLHPDRCGGLGALRNYALAFSYFIALMGFGILMLAYTTMRTPDECVVQLKRQSDQLTSQCQKSLIKDEILLKSYDISAVLAPAFVISSEKLDEKYSGFNLDVGRTLSLPGMWVFVIAYTLMSPLAFFGTLGTAHGSMLKRKHDLLGRLSTEFDRQYKEVYGNPEEVAKDKDSFDHLERIQSVHRITEAFQVWPWDPDSVRRFAIVNVPFTATTVITIAFGLSR